MHEEDPAPGRSPLEESTADQDSATPGRKPIDDERPDKEEQREHPQKEPSDSRGAD
jgi:hypothetical protein